jgi:hypothetical protein
MGRKQVLAIGLLVLVTTLFGLFLIATSLFWLTGLMLIPNDRRIAFGNKLQEKMAREMTKFMFRKAVLFGRETCVYSCLYRSIHFGHYRYSVGNTLVPNYNQVDTNGR